MCKNRAIRGVSANKGAATDGGGAPIHFTFSFSMFEKVG